MSNNAYAELMQRQYLAHREFQRAWNRFSEKESREIIEARERFFQANDELWNTLLDPLQNRFHSNPEASVDEVIDFLQVDVPAFRCGYLKEYFLQHLKSINLTDDQKERMRNVALLLCVTNTVRREFRRWTKLMILVADQNFVDKLLRLAGEQSSRERRATKLILDHVLKHRKDLSPTATNL